MTNCGLVGQLSSAKHCLNKAVDRMVAHQKFSKRRHIVEVLVRTFSVGEEDNEFQDNLDIPRGLAVAVTRMCSLKCGRWTYRARAKLREMCDSEYPPPLADWLENNRYRATSTDDWGHPGWIKIMCATFCNARKPVNNKIACTLSDIAFTEVVMEWTLRGRTHLDGNCPEYYNGVRDRERLLLGGARRSALEPVGAGWEERWVAYTDCKP
eukprot:jgi/Chlat1/9247/Chrsp99S08522